MQMARITAGMVLTGTMAGLAACAAAPDAEAGEAVKAQYLSSEVMLMGGDLVQAKVAAKGRDAGAVLDDYARCVVAGFALKNNAGFVRNVRTLTGKEGGIWRADAVYSVTSALPEGVQTIDAEVTVADCAERGIPTGETPAAEIKTGA